MNQHTQLLHLPKFTRLFYALVMDPDTDQAISWNQAGDQVLIHDKQLL